ncbi:hypothetical protein SRHO_G00138980 [Serrasalmus rhombeus]
MLLGTSCKSKTTLTPLTYSPSYWAHSMYKRVTASTSVDQSMYNCFYRHCTIREEPETVGTSYLNDTSVTFTEGGTAWTFGLELQLDLRALDQISKHSTIWPQPCPSAGSGAQDGEAATSSPIPEQANLVAGATAMGKETQWWERAEGQQG